MRLFTVCLENRSLVLYVVLYIRLRAESIDKRLRLCAEFLILQLDILVKIYLLSIVKVHLFMMMMSIVRF